MIREGRELRSRMDYIMGTGRRLLWNVSVREPRYNSDHYMFLGCLHSNPPEGTRQLPWGSQAAPPPTADHPNEGGRNIRVSMEGRPEAPGTGREEKRMDLGGHVETCQQESLRAPRSR